MNEVSVQKAPGVRPVFVAIGLIGVVVVAGVSYYLLRPTPALTEALVVAPANLDFGEVWENKGFVWTLPIENHTKTAIAISKFEASCECSSIEPQSCVIPAGQKMEVRLTLDLTREADEPAKVSPNRSEVGLKSVLGEDQAPRDFTLQIIAQTPEGLPPQEWILRGRVRSAVTLAPRVVYYGESPVRGDASTFSARTADVTALVPLRDLIAKCDPNLATLEVVRQIKDQNRFEVRITPSATLPAGAFKFDVMVYPVLSGGEELPGVSLIAKGRVREDIQVAPSELALGARLVGEKVEEAISLYSLSGKSFVIKRFEASSDTSLKLPTTAEPASRYAYSVTQMISKLGSQAGEILFFVQTSEADAQLVAPLKVSYFGIPR